MLRIFAPTPPEPKPDDLLLEANLGDAIIQIGVCRFVSSAPQMIQLGVLHPRKFAVYNVIGSEATSVRLELAFAHVLKRSSSSFVVGRFGGSAIDQVCILAMDGMLQFFTKDALSFARAIPSFLLPGPLLYVPSTDSIVTASASCTVDSYRYLVLSSSVEGAEEGSTQPQKRVKADWTLNIGEHVIDLNYSADADVVIALCERSIFWASSGGALRLCKRLVAPPLCIATYGFAEGAVRALLASSDGVVLVLAGSRIAWTARVDSAPVCLAVGSFSNTPGVIVALDETGAVSCSFLGTDPSLPPVTHNSARDVDYEKADAELRAIQKKIRGTLSGEIVAPEPIDGVKITVDVMGCHRGRDQRQTVGAKIDVLHPGPGVLADTTLRIHAPGGWVVDHSEFPLPELDEDGDTAVVHVVFTPSPDVIPLSLSGEASMAYMNHRNEPRVVASFFSLPFSGLCTGIAPSKTAIFKIVIAADCPQPSLADLFSDVACPSFLPTAIGLRFACGPEATIIASKGRYRVQSDSFGILYIVVSELERRLRGAHTGCAVTCTDELPLPDLFILIDQHYELRHARTGVRMHIEEQGVLYRTIQKRLLARFKDNTPTPLQDLYALLQTCHSQILELADKELEIERSIVMASNRLAGGVRLLLLLIRLQLQLDASQVAALEDALCVDCPESISLGWEECVLSALTHLAKTCLAKGQQEAIVNPAPLALPDDINKLRKSIVTVCERLKTAKLVFQ